MYAVEFCFCLFVPVKSIFLDASLLCLDLLGSWTLSFDSLGLLFFFFFFVFFSLGLFPSCSDTACRCSLHVGIVDEMASLLTVLVVCVLRALARDLLLRLAGPPQFPSRCWILPERVTFGSHPIHSESTSTPTPPDEPTFPSILLGRTLNAVHPRLKTLGLLEAHSSKSSENIPSSDRH